jgi:hypothetical protein
MTPNWLLYAAGALSIVLGLAVVAIVLLMG